MRFSPVPVESKKRVNKAGQILVDNDADPKDLEWALDLADRWRACHAYPINTFQATLRSNLKSKKYSGDPFVAQRLKRMPTIIDKLRRYPNMQLTTMQDIGGVRAVMNSVEDVYRLVSSYKEKTIRKQFPHELIDEKDYIQEPRDEDGYRSIHLVFKYINKQNSQYDGLRVELQVRSKLQHTWATAVETMGTLLGQALKSRMGDRQWLDFFAITSSAFSYIENCAPIPRYRNLSFNETAKAVSEANDNLGALTTMKGFSVAVDHIFQNQKGWSYHLITLNSLERTVNIRGYNRDSLGKALQDLAKLEDKVTKGMKIEPVLVSAGPLTALQRAYPNFFLDIDEFVKIISQIIEKSKR